MGENKEYTSMRVLVAWRVNDKENSGSVLLSDQGTTVNNR